MNNPSFDYRLLRKLISIHFDESGLQTLCFDLNILYEELTAEGFNGKTQELIRFMDSNSRLDELVALLKEERPNIEWPDPSTTEISKAMTSALSVLSPRPITLAEYDKAITTIIGNRTPNKLTDNEKTRFQGVTRDYLNQLTTPEKGVMIQILYNSGYFTGEFISVWGIDLRGVNLNGVELNGIDLSEANLRGASLRGASLRGAILKKADLSGADLCGADLSGADLELAILGVVNLSGADLSGANLRQSVLRVAQLKGADLRFANLSGADLSGADLLVTNLNEANLENVVLTNALNLEYALLPDKFGSNINAFERNRLLEQEVDVNYPIAQKPNMVAYAVAQIKDHQESQAILLQQYITILAAVLTEMPEGQKSEPITLPTAENKIHFQIMVYAEDMVIVSDHIQPFIFYRDKETPPIEFILRPTQTGPKHIWVEFLYQNHWLAKIEFEVEVIANEEEIAV